MARPRHIEGCAAGRYALSPRTWSQAFTPTPDDSCDFSVRGLDVVFEGMGITF